MKVVHYYAKYLEHFSGVTESISRWADACVTNGLDTSIICAKVPSPSARVLDGTAVPVQITRHLGQGRSSWIPVGLGKLIARGDVVILHEGWVASNLVAAAVARRAGAVVVINPHGAYAPMAVAKVKDIFGFRRALERVMINSAAAIHLFYSGEIHEVQDLSPMVKAARVALFPNAAPNVKTGEVWAGGGDYFFWFGRFDLLHKGIDRLVEAWARLPEPLPHLRLAGPDYERGKERLADLIDEYGMRSHISIEPAVSGDTKWNLIKNSRGYLHPSRWEAASMALLECLAAGVPCAVAPEIQAFNDMKSQDIVYPLKFDHLEDSLAAIDSNRQLSATARNWACGPGSWEQIGAEYAKWLRGLTVRNAITRAS